LFPAPLHRFCLRKAQKQDNSEQNTENAYDVTPHMTGQRDILRAGPKKRKPDHENDIMHDPDGVLQRFQRTSVLSWRPVVEEVDPQSAQHEQQDDRQPPCGKPQQQAYRQQYRPYEDPMSVREIRPQRTSKHASSHPHERPGLPGPFDKPGKQVQCSENTEVAAYDADLVRVEEILGLNEP